MHESHQYVFIDPGELAESRNRVRAGDTKLVAALAHLVEDAELALAKNIGTVVDKNGIAPSGHKRDFWAMGAYSWPNPDTATGLPYVYRDSQYNAEASESRQFDKGPYSAMVAATKTLSLAWFFTGDMRYASRAADLIRAWFTDPKTRMRPNFRHAAARPGVFDGHHSGVIEGVVLIEMLDYIALMGKSSAWSQTDHAEIRKWFLELSHWYAHSTFGRKEAAATNNHSSYYLAQVMAFAIFGGDHERAQAVIPLARKQLRRQVAEDGSLPREIARPNDFHYSVYGLQAFVVLARLSDRYNADLWHFRRRERHTPILARALAWLAQYCSGDKPWTWPEFDSGQPALALPMYRIASRTYESSELSRVVMHLSGSDRHDHAALIYPPPAPSSDAESALFQTPRAVQAATGGNTRVLGRARKKLRTGLVTMRALPEGRLP